MSTQASSTNTTSREGELSLSALLSTLSIILHPTTYVFATIPSSQFNAPDFPIPLADILLFFREPRSDATSQVTLILPLSTATLHSIEYTYPCKMLTCNVHSSLSAVGFMATLATKLAERGISVNPVSGFFHDHLFVPVESAEEAVGILERVRREAGERREV